MPVNRYIHPTYSIEVMLEWDDAKLAGYFADQSGTRRDGETVRDWLLQQWLEGKKVLRRTTETFVNCPDWNDVAGCPGHGDAMPPWRWWHYQREMLELNHPTVTAMVQHEGPPSKKPKMWKARSAFTFEKQSQGKGCERKYCWQCNIRHESPGNICAVCRGVGKRNPNKTWTRRSPPKLIPNKKP